MPTEYEQKKEEKYEVEEEEDKAKEAEYEKKEAEYEAKDEEILGEYQERYESKPGLGDYNVKHIDVHLYIHDDDPAAYSPVAATKAQETEYTHTHLKVHFELSVRKVNYAEASLTAENGYADNADGNEVVVVQLLQQAHQTKGIGEFMDFISSCIL